MSTPRYAPRLDPQAVVRLQQGRVPVTWQSRGPCAQCGLVLLPGDRRDYGDLPECPWCLVRQRGGRLPSVAFVRARLSEWGMPVSATGRPSCHAATVSGEPVTSSFNAVPARRVRADPSSCGDAEGNPDDPHANDPLASPPDEGLIGSIDDVPHHPLETGWIEAQRATVSDPVQRVAWRQRYGAVYQAAFDAEPDPIRQEGRARFVAHTDLRERLAALAKLRALASPDEAPCSEKMPTGAPT